VIFRALVFWWGFLQALLSRMDHIEKSSCSRSGLEGAHIDLSQKDGNTNFQKSWTKTAVCWCTILHECIRLVPISVLEPWDNLGFKHVFVDSSIDLDPILTKIKGSFRPSSITPAHFSIFVEGDDGVPNLLRASMLKID